MQIPKNASTFLIDSANRGCCKDPDNNLVQSATSVYEREVFVCTITDDWPQCCIKLSHVDNNNSSILCNRFGFATNLFRSNLDND